MGQSYAAPQTNQSSTTSQGPERTSEPASSNAFAAEQLGANKDEQTVPKGGGTHTIVAGDTLSGIAKAVYGEMSLWTHIRDANPGKVRSGGNLILVGDVLKIPKLDVPAPESDATGLDDWGMGAVCLDPAVEATIAIEEALAANDVELALGLLGSLDDATFQSVIAALDMADIDRLRFAASVVALLSSMGVDQAGDPSLSGRLEDQIVDTVVIPTTLLKPAADTIDDDFKRANEIYNPHGIELEKGTQVVLDEKATKKVLGGDTELDEFTGDKATQEELDLIKGNRSKGRLSGYWVPTMPDSRGEALTTSLKNILEAQTSVVVNATDRAQDTFAHEVGHALGLDHNNGSKNNLMASGGKRDVSGGAGTDQLSAAEIQAIRKSSFIEDGKKGLGQ